MRYPRFRAGTLRQSTIDIASSLEPRFREIVPRLLNEIYDLREQEERLERGEIGNYNTLMKRLRILINIQIRARMFVLRSVSN